MRTSILALTLAAFAPVLAHAQSPSWQTNYADAQQKAAAQHKPLAVVFGQGANGWQQVTGSAPSGDVTRTLADKYICCYVDTSAPAGQALARKFDITSPTGLVISDRTGSLQAFWHQGSLSADAFSSCVSRYADPQRPVLTTDTNASATRTSFYPPTAPIAGNAGFAAAYFGMGGAPSSIGGPAGYGSACSGGSCGSVSCGSGGCGGGQSACGSGGCGGGRHRRHR